jgi:hypothetical protein
MEQQEVAHGPDSDAGDTVCYGTIFCSQFDCCPSSDAGIDDATIEFLAGRLPKKSPADQRSLYPPNLPQRPLAQAAAQRVADEQRARQYRRADGDAEQDGQVAATMKDEAAAQQMGESHGISSLLSWCR